MKSILVTGSNGLLGQHVVNSLIGAGYYVTGIGTSNKSICSNERFKYISADLTKCTEVERIFAEYEFSHVIHLAAIAHVLRGMNISWGRYYRVNTMMSRQIFECASELSIPVFFASSIDIYGITEGLIDESTVPGPIGYYAKSKYLAERALAESAKAPYLIARFAPIYTEDDRSDVQKRYYIIYPKICYCIGNGLEYEFLSIDKVIGLITDWCRNPDNYNRVINLCDDKPHNTKAFIEDERKHNRAKFVLHIPQLKADIIKFLIEKFFGKEFLLRFNASKILSPVKILRNQNKE